MNVVKFIDIYLRSSSNSLQLNLVINDVNAAGMMMMGVRDGRLLASDEFVCNLSADESIGFGMVRLAVG
jgi:hypothetical protein